MRSHARCRPHEPRAPSAVSDEWPADGGVLLNATIERVDTPTRDVVTLCLRDVSSTTGRRRMCLVLAVGAPCGMGLVLRRPRGEAVSAFGMLLRKHTVGSRITRVRISDTTVSLSLEDQGARRSLELDRSARPVELALRGADDTVLGTLRGSRDAPARRSAGSSTDPADRGSLEDAGARLVAAFAQEDLSQRTRALAGTLARSLVRLRRRATAIAADLDRLAGADEMRRIATLLAPLASRLPAGTTSARVTDWSRDPPEELDVPLDPARPAREQVETMFRRARGFDRGRTIAETRAAATAREIALYEALARRTAEASSVDAIEAIAEDARRAGLHVEHAADPARSRHAARPSAKPFRVFRASGGRSVLVGKSAAGNDELTLRVARAHDLWLHARDYPGSHVVVPLERGASCPSELLVDAAHLAAHFSGARGAERVEVTYVERRYVRKPKGAAVGSVLLDRERVMLLALDADRLATLLAAELPPA